MLKQGSWESGRWNLEKRWGAHLLHSAGRRTGILIAWCACVVWRTEVTPPNIFYFLCATGGESLAEGLGGDGVGGWRAMVQMPCSWCGTWVWESLHDCSKYREPDSMKPRSSQRPATPGGSGSEHKGNSQHSAHCLPMRDSNQKTTGIKILLVLHWYSVKRYFRWNYNWNINHLVSLLFVFSNWIY